ncbi:MAG: winged helix-turn-helix domain-containing protein, partial [Candidatus Thiodiazotropha sp. (ex Lucinoma aequizonata)]|nr:winged helix-turn-helix domain-containing protein [Candidatus Thiodiazotropha sp. (ex Lucinoma aequizonata)]
MAEILLLDDQTIRNYTHIYESSGIDGLLETNYKGRQPTLSEEQEFELCEILDAEIYLTTTSICELVADKYNVTYTISGMTDMLRRLGYVYKKPKLVPGNPDEAQQAVFVAQFNKFMEEKADDEAVIFMDAVHPIHNAIAGCGWIRKGEDK